MWIDLNSLVWLCLAFVAASIVAGLIQDLGWRGWVYPLVFVLGIGVAVGAVMLAAEQIGWPFAVLASMFTVITVAAGWQVWEQDEDKLPSERHRWTTRDRRVALMLVGGLAIIALVLTNYRVSLAVIALGTWIIVFLTNPRAS